MNKIAALLFFFACSFNTNIIAQHAERANAPMNANAYKIGDTADDFKLQNVDGTMQSLSSIKDVNGYILVFTSNECPFAKAYENRLIELHKEMAAKGYPVIAINSNDGAADGGNTMDDMAKRHKEKEFPFLYLKDSEQKVYPKFGATKTPEVFILDSDMVVRYMGAIDDSPREPEEVTVRYVAQAIEAIEGGNEPELAVTKAIGCPIAKGARGPKGGPRGESADGNRPPRQKPSPARLVDMMDMDNDSMISKAEAQGPLAREFDSLDTNKDGKLSIDELGNK